MRKEKKSKSLKMVTGQFNQKNNKTNKAPMFWSFFINKNFYFKKENGECMIFETDFNSYIIEIKEGMICKTKLSF